VCVCLAGHKSPGQIVITKDGLQTLTEQLLPVVVLVYTVFLVVFVVRKRIWPFNSTAINYTSQSILYTSKRKPPDFAWNIEWQRKREKSEKETLEAKDFPKQTSFVCTVWALQTLFVDLE
jgi:hypothetical protein